MSGINPPVMTASAGGPDSHAIKKLKLADKDGDSTMQSSGELAPMTPHNHANALSDELSPPNSQGPPSLTPHDDGSIDAALAEGSALNANGKRALASASGSMATTAATAGSSGPLQVFEDPETGYQWAKQEDQPGWAWMNPRAREEASRAMDHIVDTGSMIRTHYGDPLDETVPAK